MFPEDEIPWESAGVDATPESIAALAPSQWFRWTAAFRDGPIHGFVIENRPDISRVLALVGPGVAEGMWAIPYSAITITGL